jgi:hypothetical protein
MAFSNTIILLRTKDQFDPHNSISECSLSIGSDDFGEPTSLYTDQLSTTNWIMPSTSTYTNHSTSDLPPSKPSRRRSLSTSPPSDYVDLAPYKPSRRGSMTTKQESFYVDPAHCKPPSRKATMAASCVKSEKDTVDLAPYRPERRQSLLGMFKPHQMHLERQKCAARTA